MAGLFYKQKFCFKSDAMDPEVCDGLLGTMDHRDTLSPLLLEHRSYYELFLCWQSFNTL